MLAFSVVSFIEALLRGLCLHFFYCVLSYRLVSSLGTNQRRKFLPDYICKCGMRMPSRLTISLVSKFLKQSEPFLVRERIKNFFVRPIISDVIMPGTSQKSLQERVTGFKRGKMLPRNWLGLASKISLVKKWREIFNQLLHSRGTLQTVIL